MGRPHRPPPVGLCYFHEPQIPAEQVGSIILGSEFPWNSRSRRRDACEPGGDAMDSSQTRSRLSMPACPAASFSSSNDSEKHVPSSAVKLLVSSGRRNCEAHHRQKLCKELRGEMPPRVPEEILRGRCQAADGGAFQLRIQFVYDDK